MNWIGGQLNHVRSTKNRSYATAKQKAYFARSRQQHAKRDHGQKLLEDYGTMAPTVENLASTRPRSTTRRHNAEDPAVGGHIRRGQVFSAERSMQATEYGGHEARVKHQKREASILITDKMEVKRQELLARSDWLDVRAPRPLHMQFSTVGEKDLVGKRRNLGGEDEILRRASPKRQKRSDIRYQDLLRRHEYAEARPQHLDDLSVRIGTFHSTLKTETAPARSQYGRDANTGAGLLDARMSNPNSPVMLLDNELDVHNQFDGVYGASNNAVMAHSTIHPKNRGSSTSSKRPIEERVVSEKTQPEPKAFTSPKQLSRHPKEMFDGFSVSDWAPVRDSAPRERPPSLLDEIRECAERKSFDTPKIDNTKRPPSVTGGIETLCWSSSSNLFQNETPLRRPVETLGWSSSSNLFHNETPQRKLHILGIKVEEIRSTPPTVPRNLARKIEIQQNQGEASPNTMPPHQKRPGSRNIWHASNDPSLEEQNDFWYKFVHGAISEDDQQKQATAVEEPNKDDTPVSTSNSSMEALATSTPRYLSSPHIEREREETVLATVGSSVGATTIMHAA